MEFSDYCPNIQQKIITVGSVEIPQYYDDDDNTSIYGWVTDIVPDGWELVDVADCLVEETTGIWGINIVVDPSSYVDYAPGDLSYWWQIRFNIVDVVVEN